MNFPPIKSDRCLLWITLRPDETVRARYEVLRAVLKQCRLHPLDTTAVSEIVIVEEAAFRARLDDVRATLDDGDMLHMVSRTGDRLQVTAIVPPEVSSDPLPARPPERRPPWLR